MTALGEALESHHRLKETLKAASPAVISWDGSLPVARPNELTEGNGERRGEGGDAASESHPRAANLTCPLGGIDLLSLLKPQKGNQI